MDTMRKKMIGLWVLLIAESMAIFYVVGWLLIPNIANARTAAVDRSAAVDGTLILSVKSSEAAAPQTFLQSIADSGQAYTTTTLVPPQADSVRRELIPFDLNIGQGAQRYMSCISENGFLWLYAAKVERVCPPKLAFNSEIPSSNVIFADYADLAYDRVEEDDLDGTTDYATGLAVLDRPFTIARARGSATVVWYEQPYVGAPGATTQQVLLVDRGNGDFDLMFNWEDSATTRGWHGFMLGGNQFLVRHANERTPDRFCFRHGVASIC